MQRGIFYIFVFLLPFCQELTAQKPNTDSLLAVVNKKLEDTGTVIAYRMLTGITYSVNTARAIQFGMNGVALGKKIGYDRGVAGCFLNLGVAYAAGGKLDSALIYVDTAISWSLKVGEPARIALAYLNRADYHRQLGNMKAALANCDTSLVFAEKANKDDTRARIYQTIGSVYHMQDNWAESRKFYEKAYRLYEKVNNKGMMAISMNNLGNVFKHLGYYDTAIGSFNEAIRISGTINDLNNLSMYYSNISDVYLLRGDLKEAEAAGLQSLRFAREQENEIQIAAAEASLANAYLKTSRFPAAVKAAYASYTLYTNNEMTAERQNAADLLAEASYRSGNFKDAYEYAAISKTLLDSVSKEKYAEEVARLQTSFNVAEKDKEIELLAKDKLLQQQKLQRQRILIFSSIAIALLAITGIGLLMNRNKLKQRMKELELRNRIAADLHDEVGSSLSSIHMLSQMANKEGGASAQKDILSRMSNNARETMDKMGDIVWMIKPGESESGSLKQRMERFAYEICTTRNIELNMELAPLEQVKLSMDQRKNIYLIFKEAVNNAVKYSGTDKMEIGTVYSNKALQLWVTDHGAGFDTHNSKKGNGLENMQYRSLELRGNLQVHSIPGKGTEIRLTVPV